MVATLKVVIYHWIVYKLLNFCYDLFVLCIDLQGIYLAFFLSESFPSSSLTKVGGQYFSSQKLPKRGIFSKNIKNQRFYIHMYILAVRPSLTILNLLFFWGTKLLYHYRHLSAYSSETLLDRVEGIFSAPIEYGRLILFVTISLSHERTVFSFFCLWVSW